MNAPLNAFRDRYQETLLDFLWREWTAVGVAGQNRVAPHHVVDPEALLLITCTVGRYDPRLFDEVMDWMVKNGRFVNVQRLRNILRKEAFRGGPVIAAVAEWLGQQGATTKWKVLATPSGVQSHDTSQQLPGKLAKAGKSLAYPEGVPPRRDHRVHESPQPGRPYDEDPVVAPLFYLPDRRPVPVLRDTDAIFQRHGFLRVPLAPRGYAVKFPADTLPARLLGLRALFGVNIRSDVLNHLSLRTISHPREVARELYFSQKAIHDVLTDLEYAGAVVSVKGARERTFRLTPRGTGLLFSATEETDWINWPVLLAAAESVWNLTEELHAAPCNNPGADARIARVLSQINARLTQTRWGGPFLTPDNTDVLTALESFRQRFETISR